MTIITKYKNAMFENTLERFFIPFDIKNALIKNRSIGIIMYTNA